MIKRIVYIVCAFLLVSCGDSRELQDLKKYVKTIKEKANIPKNKPISPVLALPKPTQHKITFKHSPFQEKTTLTAKTTLNPLEAYSLDVLRIKGTIIEPSGDIAYIMTPDKKVYNVKVGDIIGDRKGIILHIYENKIDVEETVSDSDKPLATHIVSLQIKEDH